MCVGKFYPVTADCCEECATRKKKPSAAKSQTTRNVVSNNANDKGAKSSL